MRILHAALAAVVLALASGTALARIDGGGGAHAGGFAAHAGSAHVSGGHLGGSGHGFSGAQFAHGNAGGHFVDHGFHRGIHAGPRIGVIVGGPLFVDPYYYAPAYAPAPALYCASAGAYYPAVPYCPEGWQRVLPPIAPY